MTRPSLNKLPSQADIDAIEETKNGQKILGRASANGATIFFLADGSDVIEDAEGNELAEWPEYVPPPAPVEEVQADE